MKPSEHLPAVCDAYGHHGPVVAAEPLRIGHINETWVVSFQGNGSPTRLLVQRLNSEVFKAPAALMENLLRVTAHIREKMRRRHPADAQRRSLQLVLTQDQKPWFQDPAGQWWRAYHFIEGTRTCEIVDSPRQAFEAARAFGQFQRDLVDLPGDRLVETIPHFHNTRVRFAALLAAIDADPLNRGAAVRQEIEFAQAREAMVDRVAEGLANGTLPERVTHNDTKVNNVLLDSATGEGLCVVDLDTVMPGCVLYDFGDLVRTTTSASLEDERDLSKVEVRLPMFEGLARGYWSTAGEFLTPAEKQLLAFAGKLITFETGLRFLTDYLLGDSYFRIHRPGQNLDRCRTQFALVAALESAADRLERCIDQLD